MLQPPFIPFGKKLPPLVTSIFVVLCLFSFSQTVHAQTSAFTYQGKLNDAGSPANGPYDFLFKLFSLPTGGSQIGADVTVDDAPVSAGIFTVTLDFGSSPFTTNSGNFLEIAVRPGASTGAYTTLTTRQPITASPYSVQTIRATSAGVADNSLQLGGVAASQYVQTNDVRLSDSRNPLPNSSNYVQNTTTQQAANFNINGNGTAGVLDATQFNSGGNRVLTVAGTSNVFAGLNAGQANTSGSGNSFFGQNAGMSNTTAGFNGFFGFGAGHSTTTGTNNDFFGFAAGASNTTGMLNSFFGDQVGSSNSGGSNNSFFGSFAGLFTSTGGNNTFVGGGAGQANTTGGLNSAFGFGADVASGNLFHATAIGAQAIVSTSNTVLLGRSGGQDTVQVPGPLNVTGTLTANGSGLTNLNASNITTGTLSSSRGGTGLNAAGAAGNVLRSDGANWTSSALLASDVPGGSGNYIQNTLSSQNANFNIAGVGTAGAFDAAFEYRIGGVTTLRSSFANSNVLVGFTGAGGMRNTFVGSTIGGVNTGTDNSFFGNAAGTQNTSGSANSFFGSQAGQNNSTATENSFFGFEAGVSDQTGCCNSFFGRSAGQQSTTGTLNTFIGNEAGGGNTSGGNNTFIGALAGDTNVGGLNNTVVGNNADVGFNNLANATAIGWRALVTTSNSLVLGSINGMNGANASTNVGIGTSGPGFKLHVIDSSNTGLRVQTNTAGGTVASFGGNGAFQVDATGVAGGRLNIAENGNVGIGTASPNAKLQVAGGSIYITHPNSLIITSPSGACWFITVNDTGGLSTLSMTCP